jgi:ParB-like chromosome segregation protein Spo0J
MNIQRIAIEELRPAPYNPRKGLKPGMPGYRRLERSLREFDLVQPLVWNRATGHVVSGHQRLEILKSKGVKEVDVVVVDLPLPKEKALNIALNNPLVGGEWEGAKLVDLVRELERSAEADVGWTGFDDDALRDLLLAPAGASPDGDEDASESEMVRVTLEVPAGSWESLRAELDPLVAEHGVRVHVRHAKPEGVRQRGKQVR